MARPGDLDPRTAVVRRGYDEIADRFLAWGAKVVGDPRERFVESFAELLAPGARVLDLGCGAGVPTTRVLAEQFDVTGIDISAEQIARARRNVPAATFLEGDIEAVAFPHGSFDGAAATYSISHIPRARHAALFCKISRWLVPGGVLLASLAAAGSPDWKGMWLGVPMFFSSHDAATNRRLLRAAGFDLVMDEIVTMREPEGEASFQWVLARQAGAVGR